MVSHFPAVGKWNPQRLSACNGDSNGCGAAEGRLCGSGRGALATSGVPRRATKGLHRRRAFKAARGGLSHFRLAVDEAEQATADAADVARSERATAVRETGRLERQIPSSTCQGSPRLCGGQRLALWNRLRQWRLVHFASERQWRLASKDGNGRRAWKWNRHRRRGRQWRCGHSNGSTPSSLQRFAFPYGACRQYAIVH